MHKTLTPKTLFFLLHLHFLAPLSFPAKLRRKKTPRRWHEAWKTLRRPNERTRFQFVFLLVPSLSGYIQLICRSNWFWFCVFGLQGSSKGEGSSSSNSEPSMPVKVWQPGVDKIEEGEELQCDPSAYNSLHAFHIGWPCLRSCKCRYFYAFM